MPSRMSSSISVLLLATTAGLTLPASAQTAPSPLFQSFANGGLKVGCPWLMSNDADTNNTGLVDVAATYRFSTIPVNPGNGGKIRLTGKFPKARYFSFQTYDGFRPGKVPVAMVKKRFREEIEKEIVDRLLPRYWKQAQAEKDIEISRVVQLADLIQEKTQPDGLAIVMEASHYCMAWRGVKDMDSKMINSVMRGAFLKDPNLRREFLSLIPGKN